MLVFPVFFAINIYDYTKEKWDAPKGGKNHNSDLGFLSFFPPISRIKEELFGCRGDMEKTKHIPNYHV